MTGNTLGLLLICLVLSLVVWRGVIAVRTGRDAYRRGLSRATSVGWALESVLAADRYWWGARLDRLSVPEARDLLQVTAQAHHLSNVINLRCPLCDHEIENAFSVAADGELCVRRQTTCPHCDFRLDACRHCAHFRPAVDSATLFDRQGDFGQGRCTFYRAVESVRTAYPQHARRLEAMGYDMLPVPKPIMDTYIPLEECTAFALKAEYLRHNDIPWINRQRIALIWLQQKIDQGR